MDEGVEISQSPLEPVVWKTCLVILDRCDEEDEEDCPSPASPPHPGEVSVPEQHHDDDKAHKSNEEPDAQVNPEPEGDRLQDVTTGSGSTSETVQIPATKSKVRSCKKRTKYFGAEEFLMCPFCRKFFKTGSELVLHARVHSNKERPFKCKRCPKRFRQACHLRTHSRLHTSERPYRCTQCDRRFVQLRRLESHAMRCFPAKPKSASTSADANQLLKWKIRPCSVILTRCDSPNVIHHHPRAKRIRPPRVPRKPPSRRPRPQLSHPTSVPFTELSLEEIFMGKNETILLELDNDTNYSNHPTEKRIIVEVEKQLLAYFIL